MLSLIQFIHVVSVVILIGFYVASFLLVAINMRYLQTALFRSALKASLMADGLMFVLLLIVCFSGIALVFYYDLPFEMPWLVVARELVIIVFILWAMIFLIKLKNHVDHQQKQFHFKKLFYGLHLVVFVIFCLAVHDAVTQSTWLYPGV
jgi:uncharacterized membrane protein